MRAMLLALAVLAHPGRLAAQNLAGLPIKVGDVVSVAAAGAVYFAPSVFNWNEHLPSCGTSTPCDPSSIPGVDRWALTSLRPTWDSWSTVLLFAGGVGVWTAEWEGGQLGRERVVASLQAAAWAAAGSELLKVAVARKRPILYAQGSFVAAGDIDNQRSFPSTHASIAFALATSYALDRGALGQPKTRAVALLVLAGGVGALRVVAGKHFPTDVAAGAALGAASAIVVHVIKF